MRQRKNQKIFAIILMALLALTSCKSESEKFIDLIKISSNQVSFEYITTFTPNFEADLEGEFPVGNYGSIRFFNDEQNRMNVAFKAMYTLFKDSDLLKVTKLPNGADFPTLVEGPLLQYKAKDNSPKYRLFAYVDEVSEEANAKKLVGIALELGSVSNNFPQISFTQNFYKLTKKVASFTVYGPREVDGKILPGGIFMVGDAATIFNQPLNADHFMISGPDAAKYQDRKSQRKVFEQLRTALAVHGIYLK